MDSITCCELLSKFVFLQNDINIYYFSNDYYAL